MLQTITTLGNVGGILEEVIRGALPRIVLVGVLPAALLILVMFLGPRLAPRRRTSRRPRRSHRELLA